LVARKRLALEAILWSCFLFRVRFNGRARKGWGIVFSRRFLSVSSRSSYFRNDLIKSLMNGSIP